MVLENDRGKREVRARVDTTVTTTSTTTDNSTLGGDGGGTTSTTTWKRTTTQTVESRSADDGRWHKQGSTVVEEETRRTHRDRDGERTEQEDSEVSQRTSLWAERSDTSAAVIPRQRDVRDSEEEEEEGIAWVEDIDELAELFEKRKGLGRQRHVRGICGRVTKGRTEEDFRLLSDEPNKRLSWVVGSDGLERLCGKSPREIMLAIGKDTPWLRHTLEEGYRFKLCLFPEVQARQATWEGVFELVRDTFPEAWPKVEPHIHLLPKYTLEEVQESFTEFDICASFLEGRGHHHYMTLERYLESDGTLGHTRAFLYHELGLTHLFYGDGFTRTEEGKVGLREYLVPNLPLSSFAKHRIVDMPLDMDELPPEEVIPDP